MCVCVYIHIQKQVMLNVMRLAERHESSFETEEYFDTSLDYLDSTDLLEKAAELHTELFPIRCGAECCCVLQRVIVCCSMLQRGAECCSGPNCRLC